jgi:hypothetical protein
MPNGGRLKTGRLMNRHTRDGFWDDPPLFERPRLLPTASSADKTNPKFPATVDFNSDCHGNEKSRVRCVIKAYVD